MYKDIQGFVGPRHLPCCGVTAMAVCTGIPFNIVFEETRKHLIMDSKNWAGQTRGIERAETIKALGFKMIKVYDYTDHLDFKRRKPTMSTIETWAKKLPHGKNYLITVTGHAMAMRDGQITDQGFRTWTKASGNWRSKQRVMTIYEIVKA